MDGTLTPAREKVDDSVLFSMLGLLQRGGGDIAIVSGSNFQYVHEQLGQFLPNYSMGNRVKLLPCNGTQIYEYIGDSWEQTYSVSMKDEVGDELYQKLIDGILHCQITRVRAYPDLPISGSFISYRGSTLNWSLIGRDSSKAERDAFANHEKNVYIRTILLNLLKNRVHSGKIEYALGGQTSIDIFPKGWDKTYALKHFKDKECWFVGDRCEPGENDFHIWEELNKHGRAFKTSGPEETIQIMDQLINTFSD
jgi:phosphomannomutase